MNRSLRLGIFIVFTLAAAAAAIFLIGSKSLLFARTYRLYADFANVAGLEGGAPVDVAGLQKGTVEHILLPQRPGLPVRVEMKLQADTRPVVKLDSTATIETQGLVGEQFIEVSIGSAHSPSVRNGGTIQGRTPPQLTDLITHAQKAIDQANGALGNLNSITSKIDSGKGTLGALLNNPSMYNHFNQATGNLAAITGKLNSGQGSLGALLNDRSVYDHFNTAAGNLAAITGKLNSGKGSLGALLNDRSAYDHFNTAAGNLAAITGKLNSGQGSLGALLNDRSAYDHFNTAASNLDAITGKINSGQGTVGQLMNNPGLFDRLNQTAANVQDDTEALKHNFLLRGFFKHRGYENDSDLARYAIPQLPSTAPAAHFDFSGGQLYEKKDDAEIKDGKALDAAGRYLQSHPFSMAVVSAAAGMEGDADTEKKLTEARAYSARQWLVNHFPLDSSRIKTLGLGKTPGVAPAGEANVLVYDGEEETGAERSASPPAPTAAGGSAGSAPAADPRRNRH